MECSLDQALQGTLDVLTRVRPEDLDEPTPCASWNVRGLVNHFVGTARWWAATISGHGGVSEADYAAGDFVAAYEESIRIAVMLGTTTVSVKSALQRARARLRELDLAAGQITEPAAPQARALLDQYIAAFENADATALERLLTEDAVLEATPIRTWFAGRKTCVSFLRSHLLGSGGDWRMLATGANGQPAVAAFTRDRDGSYQPYGICVLTVTDAGIRRLSSFGDPGLVTVFGFRPDMARRG